MNVKRLKEILEEYDDEAIVLISNMEFGENYVLGENDFSDSKEYFEMCIDVENLE